MLALGSVHEVIEGQIEEGKVDFDIKGFLENVVLNDAANPGMYMIFHIICLLIAFKIFLKNDLKKTKMSVICTYWADIFSGNFWTKKIVCTKVRSF